MNENMNLDRVRLLVEDLRTPGNLQGTGWLTQIVSDLERGQDVDRDCCLGRACKVALANGLEGVEAIRTFGEVSYRWTFTKNLYPQVVNEIAVLPDPVKDWFGFDSTAPNLRCPDGTEWGATDLNDEKRWDFDQIATAFEVTFLGGEYPADAMTWPGMPLDPNVLEQDEYEPGDDDETLFVAEPADPEGMLEP